MRSQTADRYCNRGAAVSVKGSDGFKSLEVIEVYLAGAANVDPRPRDDHLHRWTYGCGVIANGISFGTYTQNIVVPSEVDDLNGR